MPREMKLRKRYLTHLQLALNEEGKKDLTRRQVRARLNMSKKQLDTALQSPSFPKPIIQRREVFPYWAIHQLRLKLLLERSKRLEVGDDYELGEHDPDGDDSDRLPPPD